ncbi:MAG: ABC transporter ATP-binding protein [Pseudomonadota bacterium]
MNNGKTVISLEGVTFSYGAPLVLEDITMEVEAGEFLGIVGPNGGGKSTLLKIILGLLEPTRGRVEVLGKSPRHASRAIGYVPQFVPFSREFPISVEETVLLGRLRPGRLWHRFTRADREIARSAMRETRVDDLRDRPLATLSGGQLQRVLIARALACEPEILILDEPTANIDLRGETDIFDLLRSLHSHPTILVVSHDIGFISQYVQRVACLNRTLVCHQTDRITGEVIEQLYDAPVRMIHHVH